MSRSSLPKHSTATDAFSLPSDWLPSAAELVASCESMVFTGENLNYVRRFEEMGAFASDLLITPFSARAGLLAAEQGQLFFHHELRRRLSMPKGLEPEKTVWQAGSTLPIWEAGILTEPKYFSFFLDAPVAPFNPNYRRKWRSHELLHGTIGFYWSPTMTRFSFYMGARLDELLPVVHWHAFDEMFRPRCSEHRGSRMNQNFCSSCQELEQDYWLHSPKWIEAERETALVWAERGLTHFDREWTACLRELKTGQCVEVPNGTLNSSSDALGYLYSHWPRVTSWSFGSWAETFLQDGHDYFSSITAYMERVAEVSQQLVSGTIDVDPISSERLRKRRAFQDVGARCYLALEWLEDGSSVARRAEDAVLPLLEKLGAVCGELMKSTASADTGNALLEELLSTCDEVFQSTGTLPDEFQSSLGDLGLICPVTSIPEDVSSTLSAKKNVDWLTLGLQSSSPVFERFWEKAGLEKQLSSFMDSEEFQISARLIDRFLSWYKGQSEQHSDFMEWLEFEAWLTKSNLSDQEGECFAVLPEHVADISSEAGTLRIHHSFRRKFFTKNLVEEVLQSSFQSMSKIELACIHYDGESRLLALEPEMLSLIKELEVNQGLQGQLNQDENELVMLLLENGFLLWLPFPK